MAEESTPQETAAPAEGSAAPAPEAGAPEGAASSGASSEPAKASEAPNVRRLLAALSAKERKLIEKERALGAADEDAKLGRALREVREEIKAKKGARKAFDLLGADYLTVSELIANEQGGDLTDDEKIQAAVQEAITAKEREAEERRKAEAKAEAEKEQTLLTDAKNRYREKLAATLSQEATRFKTTAALGNHGIDLAFSIMETALEKGQALPIEECLSLTERHFASKLGTQAEGNQDTAAVAEAAEDRPAIKRGSRTRTLTNAKTAQPHVLSTVRKSESDRLDATAKRLVELGLA